MCMRKKNLCIYSLNSWEWPGEAIYCVRGLGESCIERGVALTKHKVMAGRHSPLITRSANKEDLEIVTRLGILEDWHFHPKDLECAYAFDPSGFFVGELNGEVISHINAVKYPGHSAYIGTFIVQKEQRRKGYGKLTWDAAWRSLDHSCTIALDGAPHMIDNYKALGFQSVWNTSAAIIDLDKTINALSNISIPSSVVVKPIRAIDFETLFKYDTEVFGAPRRKLLQSYITLPDSLGWAAVSEKGDVIGYNIVKQVSSEAGTKNGLVMAPLYADSDDIARMLVKVAAETYLATDAVPGSCFELYYSDGGSYGDHALRLMKELEVKTVYLGQRMYTKGIPLGRQIRKMYGIFSTAFD